MEAGTTDELDSFRNEWRNDLRDNLNRPIPPPSTPSSTEPSQSKPIRLFELEEELEEIIIEDSKSIVPTALTALELYSLAVLSEKEGRLNDGQSNSIRSDRNYHFTESRIRLALFNYRAAFKLDESIDKLYHKQSLIPKLTTKIGESTGGFEFERTIQLYSDYIPHEGAEYQNTQSTNLFRENLMKSFAENPWEREVIALEIDEGEVIEKEKVLSSRSVEETMATLDFIPQDPALPLYLSSIPHEVLLIILRFLLLSPNLPPPPLRPSEIPAPVVARKGKGKMNRTIQEEMRVIEMELELEKVDFWKSDVESLERFGRVCRMARILSLEEGLWRLVL